MERQVRSSAWAKTFQFKKFGFFLKKGNLLAKAHMTV